MKLYIFAGPNGSGKSTLIDGFINEPENAGLLYLCPDAFFNAMFRHSSDLEIEKQSYIKAMSKAEMVRKSCVEEGTDFAFETVFSTYEKVEFLIEAKKRGYKIISNFVTTKDVNININRVAFRASQGGHDVPVDKIEKRYYKAMEQLKYLFDISDELYIYDNSSEHYKLAYMQIGYGYYVNSKLSEETWVKKYILPYVSKEYIHFTNLENREIIEYIKKYNNK